MLASIRRDLKDGLEILLYPLLIHGFILEQKIILWADYEEEKENKRKLEEN